MPRVSDRDVLLDRVPTGVYLGGAFTTASDGGRFAVSAPAGGSEMVMVASATAADALTALGAAAETQSSWSTVPRRQRTEMLRSLHRDLVDRAAELTELSAVETGRSLHAARVEVDLAAAHLSRFVEEACRLRDDNRPTSAGESRVVVRRRPIGPVLAVTAQRFPLATLTRRVAPALAAGCCVIVMPPAAAPLTALYVADLIGRLGLPGGAFAVLPTAHPDRVTALVEDPRLRMLAFTGTAQVGRRLAARAVARGVRADLELFAAAPVVVLADADLDLAATGAADLGGHHRIFVHRSVADGFRRALQQTLSTGSVSTLAISTFDQDRDLTAALAAAPTTDIGQEEDTFGDGVTYVFSTHIGHALAVAEHLAPGTVLVNRVVLPDPSHPGGGVEAIGGAASMELYQEQVQVVLPAG